MKSSNEGPSKKRRKKKVYDGRPITMLRTVRGLTQLQLADATGMDVRKVGKFERGETAPDQDELVQLADALHVPLFVVENLREVVSYVERFAEEPSPWSGRISAEGPQPEIVREPDPADSATARKRTKRLKDAGIVIRAQNSLGETLWRLMKDPDDPER